jgi:hypothetical protein
LVGCNDAGPSGALTVDSGYVVMDDSVRLFYKAVGRGEHDIVIPVAFYLEDALRPLASQDRRLVFYDPRARGRSEAGDRSIVTIDRQIADLESVRASLGIDSMTLLGWSGLGMEMFVYAMLASGSCAAARASRTCRCPRRASQCASICHAAREYGHRGATHAAGAACGRRVRDRSRCALSRAQCDHDAGEFCPPVVRGLDPGHLPVP